MNSNAILITDRKFYHEIKVVDVDVENSIINFSDVDDGFVKVNVGNNKKFMIDYFKVCMDSNVMCSIEISNDNELINGVVEVRIKRVSGNDNDGNDDKFIISPIVKSKDIPDVIEVDVNDYKDKFVEHLKRVLSESVDIDGVLGVGLIVDEDGNEDWSIDNIQVKIK